MFTKLTKFLLYSIIALHAIPMWSVHIITVHSPNGKKSVYGKNGIFYSIQEAIDYATSLSDTVVINIEAGTFCLQKPIRIVKSHCPLLTIQGDANGKTKIVGGKTINNWKYTLKGIYQCAISEKQTDYEQLFVNGHRAQLSRTPNNGWFNIKEINEKRNDNQTIFDIKLNSSKRLLMPYIKDSTNMHVSFFHKWNVTTWRPRYISNNQLLFWGQNVVRNPYNPIVAGDRCIIYNAYEALDSIGEWYINHKTSILYYKPDKTEDLRNAVYPTTSKWIEIEAANRKDTIKNIAFNNILFEYTGKIIGQYGEIPQQAAADWEAAIDIKDADHITFNKCIFANTAASAIWIHHSAHNNTIQECNFYDIGASAIKIGETTVGKDTTDISRGNLVAYNSISACGRENPSAAALIVFQASHNTIIHNDIADNYYTGISVGWTWGYNNKVRKSYATNNTIAYNRIHKIGQGVMSDLGGIYTLGESQGTIINNNVIYDVKAAQYNGNGIYADEGSSHLLITNNLVYDCSSGPFQQNYGKDNTIVNNIFAFGKEYQLHLGKNNNSGLSFVFKHNIVCYNEGRTLSGSLAWIEKGKFVMDNNLYYGNGHPLDFATMNLKGWQQWQDKNSIEANPYFTDIKQRLFSIKNMANVNKIKFIPFTLPAAGSKNN